MDNKFEENQSCCLSIVSLCFLPFFPPLSFVSLLCLSVSLSASSLFCISLFCPPPPNPSTHSLPKTQKWVLNTWRQSSNSTCLMVFYLLVGIIYFVKTSFYLILVVGGLEEKIQSQGLSEGQKILVENLLPRQCTLGVSGSHNPKLWWETAPSPTAWTKKRWVSPVWQPGSLSPMYSSKYNVFIWLECLYRVSSYIGERSPDYWWCLKFIS